MSIVVAALRYERLGPVLVVACLLVAGLVVLAVRRRSPRLGAVAGVGLALLAVAGWAHWIEPTLIETVNVPLGWRGPRMRIVFLTDLHAAPGTSARTRGIVERTLALQPDVVLLGGDFVEALDADPRKLDALDPLADLRAPLGVHAVLGNHDSEHAGQPAIRAELERVGLHILANESVRLPNGVVIVGIADHRSGESDVVAAFAGVDPAAPTVALAHSYKSFELQGMKRFDLALAGHTHGGQACLPFTTVCPFLRWDMKQYPRGLYDWPAGGRLYVSRGLGTSEVRARLAARPEITVLELSTSPAPPE